MSLPILQLKKNEDRRIRAGHLWIYSNEIQTSLKQFKPGQQVQVLNANKQDMGIAYVNPNSLIAARLLSHKNENLNRENAKLDSVADSVIIDKAFLLKRFKNAKALRDPLFSKPFYRLIFAESDDLPGLIVDRYDQHLVMQINTAGIQLLQNEIVESLLELLPQTQSILLRNDSNARKLEGLPTEIKPAFGTPPKQVLVEENQTLFHAPIWEGQKTGWFYDHRQNRKRLVDYVKDKTVLDVFSYLGGWGIQAARLGARSVVCLDASAFAMQFILENSQLNGVEDKVACLAQDAFEALKDLQKANKKFDVIVLDPPAFIKKQKDLKEGTLAYQRINELALKLLNEGGILFSCSCSLHLSMQDLTQVLRRSALRVGCQLQILERGHQGADHPVHIAIPETDYLKMIITRKGPERKFENPTAGQLKKSY